MKRWQIVVLVIIVVLGLSGIGVARFLMPYTFEDEVRYAREHGVATTAAECFPPVPPGQNAAPDYERARKLVDQFWTKDLEDARESLSVPGGPTRAELAKLRVAFAHDNGYLAAVHAGASKPAFEFRAARDPEAFVAFGEMANFREYAKALREEASFDVYNGQPLEAVKTLRLGMNVAKHAYSHPTMIGSLVGIAIDAIMDSGYKQVLLSAGGNAEVDQAVRDALSADLTPPDISHALAGEVAVACSLIIGNFGAQKDVAEEPVYRRVFYKGVYAASIHWMMREIIASRVPPDRQRAAIQGIVDEFDRSSHHNPVVKESGEELPIALGVMDSLDTQAARRRTIYAAARVLEYHARTGAYPRALDQAANPVPIDPFSRRPLDFRRTAKGFELVAAEASRQRAAKSSSGHRTDLPFAYPGPKPPAPNPRLRSSRISPPAPPPTPPGPPMSGTP